VFVLFVLIILYSLYLEYDNARFSSPTSRLGGETPSRFIPIRTSVLWRRHWAKPRISRAHVGACFEHKTIHIFKRLPNQSYPPCTPLLAGYYTRSYYLLLSNDRWNRAVGIVHGRRFVLQDFYLFVIQTGTMSHDQDTGGVIQVVCYKAQRLPRIWRYPVCLSASFICAPTY
jgi:hypothetical protein